MSVRRTIVEVDEAGLPAAAQLVMRALGSSSYAAGAIDCLEAAARTPSAESRAFASIRGRAMEGVIVFGMFAGADGAGRILFVVVDQTARRGGVGRALVDAAVAQARSDASRFLLVELPDDAHALIGAHAFLAAMDFREESRIENFFRDGVALSFMRRDLGAIG